MDNWKRSINWYRKNFPTIPAGSKESFLRETGLENLVRLSVISVCMILITGGALFVIEADPLRLFTIILLMLSVLLFVAARLIGKDKPSSLFLVRLPVIVFSLALVWWVALIGKTDPLNIGNAGYIMLSVFVVFSLFINATRETMIILANGIAGFYLFWESGTDATFLKIAESFGYLFFMVIALVVARILYHTRLVSFLNWENISSMNETLKYEVLRHNSTLLELEASKNYLVKQVIEKTRHLRDTNQKLQEEIAERSYSDKVKSVLYRISSFVNRNNDLPDVFGYIHEQLSQIVVATNLMIGIYDLDNQEIQPAYQVNSKETFERYRLGRTLSSYIIRNKRSLLVDKKGIHELVQAGEIETLGVPANSWLGVPLMVETRVVGILMVQSYDSNCIYDKSDLQLLEYVGEHLALAIDRHETQENLIRAKEQAEESDQLKSSFLANLSHEVRTPMNAIVGFTELLSESDLEPTERQFYSGQVLENGHKLLSTLTNMVELAKIKANQMPFEPVSLEVVKTITSYAEEFTRFKSLYNKPLLEIRIRCEEDLADVSFSADPIRFQQLFSCLAENAVKFTHRGYIEIGCQRFDQKNILFWVKDSGIGMTEKEIQQVFNWFTKGQQASERLYRGTGLGLTIAKLLLENMKGKIWVESEPGEGSCFYFTLPAAIPESIRMIPRIVTKKKDPDLGSVHTAS